MSKNSMMVMALMVVALAATLAVSHGAYAAEPGQGQRMEERFKAADTDGNGTLSKEEANVGMPRIAERFDTLDTNKDGQLTQDEIRAGRKQRN